ncbi:MAG: DEAD/DEAH box helicase [Desulfovibrio sp.]|nr:DEAD/DEAH box helicase [Desulfovibrio sp.]
MPSVQEYIEALLAAPRYARQVTCHKVMEAEPARTAQTRRPLPKAVAGVLESRGVSALYAHQARAIDIVRSGRDVVVTTPTASGKTLIYNLPFLERHLEDPDATALYLFPLKALAQDQKGALERLTLHWPEAARPTVELYDGDTSDWRRAKIRKNPPNVLITNPEMLHLGILPWHEKWTTFLASLAFIVLDEAHIYRGIFGAHMAGVLERLSRICRRYSAQPVRILCTATLGNPGELGKLLLGLPEPPAVVGESGAPRGRRHMIMMDPEDSPSTLAIHLLQSALHRKLRTIVYCRSRRMTELISLWAVQKNNRFRDRISAYRAGFLPEERREIEGRLASGDLLAVVSTSALELGIDIGTLDLCILVGYPGSVMQTLQRGGRVGRSGQESAVILLGGEDALDQYFIKNPEEFFKRPPESAVLNPDNPVICARHVECAAAESPLASSEPWLQRPAVRDAVASLQREGRLLETAAGGEWLAARKRPQRDVNLRGSGSSYQIVDPEGQVIGVVDAHQAFRETHAGAVYLHHGRSYVVDRLDTGSKLAYARLESVAWHTNVRSRKATEILETYAEGEVFGMRAFFGRLRVTEQITGYERRQNASRRLMDIQPLEMEPQVFETEGLWYAIPDRLRLACEEAFYHFMGSIHALEHVSIGLMPLLIMADRSDLGGISIPMHPQVGGPAVFVYDGLPGGAGLAASAFPRLGELLLSVRRTLASCPCLNGCPSCIQSPKCGSGNRPLDKQGALFLAEGIIGGREEAPRLPAPSRQAVRQTGAALQAEREAEAASQRRERFKPRGDGPVVFFDVETRRSAKEVGGWSKACDMGVSVAVAWDGQAYRSFGQDDLPGLFAIMRSAGLVVGFNSLRFDYAVLQPFADFDLHSLPSLDLLQEIKRHLSYPVSLDNVGRATLDAAKSADGLQALAWWKEGRIEEIRAYCQRDVELTRAVYEFGRDKGYLLFTGKSGQKARVPVAW